MNLRAGAAAVLLLAGGCATLPPPTAPASADDWPSRRAALQSLDAWTLDGRIAVAAGEQGFSGGFDWSQAGERADILLSGPMGGAGLAIRVEGEALTVTMRGETYGGEDARRLVEERVGAGRPLPVAEMRYWLVGAPAPGAPAEETLGEDHRLARLAQSGWEIEYERYAPADARVLPARLTLRTEGLRLRVAVNDWRLPP
ncbi:MAG TPA: lipoprotein insertase outer membrane protein LolB [Steroidobacteraceae bacterium]|nr:lipoprotein insertase outer membrane protein LolB [Steroidobacteraceae bacterium]